MFADIFFNMSGQRISRWETKNAQTNMKRDTFRLFKKISESKKLPKPQAIRTAYQTEGKYHALNLILNAVFNSYLINANSYLINSIQ